MKTGQQIHFAPSFAGSEIVTNQIVNGVNADIAILAIERNADRLIRPDAPGAEAIEMDLVIVGGVNLSSTYQSSPGSTRLTSGQDVWHDTDLEISGPVVIELERLFQEHWRDQGGPELSAAGAGIVEARHARLGTYRLYCADAPQLLFCENDTNFRRLFEDVHVLEIRAQQAQRLDGLRGKAALGKIRRALHEQHDRGR